MITNGLSSRLQYANSYNAQAVTPQPSIDRARGGKIKVKLTFPRTKVEGGSGFVPRRVCEFEIDLEEMPLVNVAGYRTDRVQVAPDEMPYPNGATSPFEGTFR